MKQRDSIILGVDGGGTSCKAALIDSAGGQRIDVRGGPANVSEFDTAIAAVRDVVLKLFRAAGLGEADRARVVAHVGLAGVMDAEFAARVSAALPLGRTIVTNDQPTMIAGALGAENGAVAAIGTGSFIGRQNDDDIRVLGGWGFAIGDQASGAWLGRRLLTDALLAEDGIMRSTALIHDVLRRLGGAVGITAFSIRSRPADYAALAPDIVSAAEAGDTTAVALMREGAAYIENCLNVLGHAPYEKICLTGGLGPSYARWLKPEFCQQLTEPKGTALDGALTLAQRAAAEISA